MTVKPVRKRSWIKLILKLSFLAIFTALTSAVIFTVVNFCEHADRFILYLKIGDSDGTKRELEKLHYFYALSEKWKVQWLADRYLFNDAYFYQVADISLIEDWEKVKEALKDRLDDPRSYPYGIAKFRQAQAKYRATHKIEAPLNFVMTEVREDFERDLRNCLKASEYLKCWDRVFNYDLAGNKKDAEEALRQPKMPPEYILGPLKKKLLLGGEPPTGKPPGGEKLDEKKPGSGGLRKRP